MGAVAAFVLTLALAAPPAEAPPPRPVVPTAPAPRDAGTSPPPPPFRAAGSHVRPEVIRYWARNLGSEDFVTREACVDGLKAAGWDGYVAARAVANDPPCAESRSLAILVCRWYTRPVVSFDPDNRTPKILALANRYAPRPYVAPAPSPYGGDDDPEAQTAEPAGTTTYRVYTDPPDQHARALLCYWLMLRAAREDFEAARRWGPRDGSPHRGDPPVWDYWRYAGFETDATKLMVRNLLSDGVSREWVQWLIDDMARRETYRPTVCSYPPRWMVRLAGFANP